MRTPAAYNNNLKNHIITMQMLVDCLYSSNKRAKNWRDKQREYREEVTTMISMIMKEKPKRRRKNTIIRKKSCSLH